MGKNVLLMVKIHDGPGPNDYFDQLRRDGFRIDQVKFFTVHCPDEKPIPWECTEIKGLGSILSIITNWHKIQERSVFRDGGRTQIIPLCNLNDPNPD